MYRRQGSRPPPRKRNAKKPKWLSEEALQIAVTSGILDVKEEIVKKAIEDAGFDIIEVLADGEWRAIMAIRR